MFNSTDINNVTEFFMECAEKIAQSSEDPKKKVGAIIVDNHNRIISHAFNKLPGNCEYTEERLHGEDKLSWFAHAERVAIFKAAKTGTKTDYCKMYATFFPCPDCARAIIESGIRELYTKEINPDSKWHEKAKISKEMLIESGVQIILID